MKANKFLFEDSFKDYSVIIRNIQLSLIEHNVSLRKFSRMCQIDPSNMCKIFKLTTIPSAVEYIRIIKVYEYVLQASPNI